VLSFIDPPLVPRQLTATVWLSTRSATTRRRAIRPTVSRPLSGQTPEPSSTLGSDS